MQETQKSINKPIAACAWHIENYSANRIRDPFTGKWVNKTQEQWQRIMRHRNVTHTICPSCEGIMNRKIEAASRELPASFKNSINAQINLVLAKINVISNDTLTSEKFKLETLVANWRMKRYIIPEGIEEGLRLIAKVIEVREA